MTARSILACTASFMCLCVQKDTDHKDETIRELSWQKKLPEISSWQLLSFGTSRKNASGIPFQMCLLLSDYLPSVALSVVSPRLSVASPRPFPISFTAPPTPSPIFSMPSPIPFPTFSTPLPRSSMIVESS